MLPRGIVTISPKLATAAFVIMFATMVFIVVLDVIYFVTGPTLSRLLSTILAIWIYRGCLAGKRPYNLFIFVVSICLVGLLFYPIGPIGVLTVAVGLVQGICAQILFLAYDKIEPRVRSNVLIK